jgi:CheY-like chemotaxis protein
MSEKEPDFFENDKEEVRRTIHDVAATIISIRALAETLAEHVPTLVAISRSRLSPKKPQIPPKTLDSLPSISAEIVDLCALARRTLQGLSTKSSTTENVNATSNRGIAPAEDRGSDNCREQVDGEGIRILLVEDDETFQFTLSQKLKAQGYRVSNVPDGKEALSLLKVMEFDLILMDLRLPGMSGCETAKRLRQIESAQGRYTRIIGLTASPLVEEKRLAKAAGMDDVLVKPIDEMALRSVLSESVTDPGLCSEPCT